MNEQNLAAAQRRDLIAGTREVVASAPDAVRLCASCDNEATDFSCYCRRCEQDIYDEMPRWHSDDPGYAY